MRRIALTLPQTDERLSRGNAQWRVGEKLFVRLEQIAVEELEELIVEAWLARAPRRLARAYLDRLG